MASWADFEAAAPDLAEAGRRLWGEMVLGYLATTGRDGAPRVHPVVVVIADGQLAVAVIESSPKFRDLQRDGRFALHTAPVSADDEQLFLRGRVVPRNDEARRAQFIAAAPYQLDGREFVFDFEIETALWTTWYHPGQLDTHPIQRRWPERQAPEG